MDYDEYVAPAHRAAQLVEAGEHEQALDILGALLGNDISDVDKAMMCHNIGIVQEKVGRGPEALASYERGMSYKRPHGQSYYDLLRVNAPSGQGITRPKYYFWSGGKGILG